MALFQSAGAAIFLAIFANELSSGGRGIRRLGQLAAWGAILFVSGHYLLEAARAAGEISGVMDMSLQTMVLNSSSGAAWTIRMLGLLLVAAGLSRDTDLARTAAVVGAVAAISSFVITGHTAVNEARWILAPVLIIHLLVVAFWFGALLPLYLLSGSESAGGARVIERFSAAAVWIVPAIPIAGLILIVLLVPNLAALIQPYGMLLGVKALGFAVLMGFAALNKRRLGPAVVRGERGAMRAFRRSLMAEYGLIVVVLAVTAFMTTFFSPE